MFLIYIYVLFFVDWKKIMKLNIIVNIKIYVVYF